MTYTIHRDTQVSRGEREEQGEIGSSGTERKELEKTGKNCRGKGTWWRNKAKSVEDWLWVKGTWKGWRKQEGKEEPEKSAMMRTSGMEAR